MASQVMTISRICVLLWFTIFFETVRTTTPSTFTDADTSPLVTDNTTENVTMATDLPATTISNNTTENVTMATDLPATTVANNTTENVTMATDLPATTIPNNTTENVTMATDLPATTISNNTTENMTMATDLPATTITNNATENGTMPTVIPPTTKPNRGNYTKWDIISIAAKWAGFIIIIVILVVIARRVKPLGSSKSPEFSGDERTPLMKKSYEHEGIIKHFHESWPEDWSTEKAQFCRLLTEDALYEGRVSYYELRKLEQYAYEENEDDLLENAIKRLMREAGFHRSNYHSTDKSEKALYQLLCDWKKRCDNPEMNQLELLFNKCIAAKMIKSIRKLRDLRLIVSDVPDSTSKDLEHILWLIGEKSKHNITNLLEELNVKSAVIGDPSNFDLKEIVDEASKQLQEWKQGLIPINPIVMISLALEDLNLREETAAKN